MKTIWDIYTYNGKENEKYGDILCFLTGEEEIDNACAEIKSYIDKGMEEK